MAVRLRKLARELGRTPADVLGLLHLLGFKRYKSSEDMVSDSIAAKARAAVRSGMRADPIEPAAVAKRSAKKAVKPAAPDLMAGLVPGVVRQGQSVPATRAPKPADPAPAVPIEPAPEVSVKASIGVSREAHEAAVGALQVEVARLKAEVGRLTEALSSALSEASEVEAEALVPVVEILVERGLQTPAEWGLALEALAAQHSLNAENLAGREPGELRQALATRLVLFGGDVPRSLVGVAGIAVGLDRADLPGASALKRSVERAGEELMLSGCRRVRALGVPPQWHALLSESMDPRVQLEISAMGSHSVASAQRDASNTDVLWLWGETGTEAVREAWAGAPILIDGPVDFVGAIEALVSGVRT